MKNTIKGLLLILIIVVTNKSIAQQKIAGHILDSLTKQPVAYAIIQLAENTVISNLEGNFEIYIKQNNQDSLSISCLGYQTRKFAANQTNKPLYLKIENIHLNEVVVKPATIKEILIAATQTSSQKFNTAVLLYGYYREVVKRDSFISKYADGLINYYIEKDKKNKPNVTVQINQSRVKEVELKKDDDKVDAINSMIEISFLPEYINPNKLNVLDSTQFQYYDYKMVEIEGKKPVYKIIYKPIQNSPQPLNEGVIYVDKESNLILSVSSKFSPTEKFPVIKSISFLGASISLNERATYLNYKVEGDNYYPNYISVEGKLSLKSKNFKQTTEMKSEFVTLNYKNKEVLKPNINVSNKSYLYKNGSHFTNEFWKNMNVNLNSREETLFLEN